MFASYLAALFLLAALTPITFAPGSLSSPDEEYRVSFSPDGNTAYFARSPAGAWFPFSRQATIMVSERGETGWSEPVVAPFSGEYSDLDPFLSPDGNRLFFSSIRPVNGEAREDADLWLVERSGDGWGDPVHLGEGVNSPADELYPSVSEDGTLYFGSDRDLEASGWNIYRARTEAAGTYGAATKLAETINTSAWDFNPTISKDGQTLLFTGLEYEGGFGLGDIYRSRWENGSWTSPENLGEKVNSAADEFHPSLSPDEETLYFIRRAGDAGGDIFSAALGE